MPGTKRKGKGDAWYLEVTLDGKRYNSTAHGTEKQAEKALTIFYAKCEAGKINKSSTMNVNNLSELYKKHYVDRVLKKSNVKNVEPALKKILPVLGTKKVTKLTRLDVQKWVDGISEKSKTKQLAPKTVRNYYNVLSGMMKYAVRMDIIEQSPCHDILLPKSNKQEARYYSKEELACFLNALDCVREDELKYKAIMYIAVFGGLRNGEIMGLNWSDVDEINNTLTVSRERLTQKGGGSYEDTPKTTRSNRTITMPIEVMNVLKKLRIQQKETKLLLGDKWTETPSIFKNEFGDFMYPKAPAKWLAAFIKKNDLAYISMHGLRHTHTSLLAYLETDKLEISKRLGHSQLSTTLNIYTHLFEDHDKDIAEDLTLFTENLRKSKI